MPVLTRAWRLAALVLALASHAPWLAAQGQVWVVDAASGPGTDFVDIGGAVLSASDGDTILVRSGV